MDDKHKSDWINCIAYKQASIAHPCCEEGEARHTICQAGDAKICHTVTLFNHQSTYHINGHKGNAL